MRTKQIYTVIMFIVLALNCTNICGVFIVLIGHEVVFGLLHRDTSQPLWRPVRTKALPDVLYLLHIAPLKYLIILAQI